MSNINIQEEASEFLRLHIYNCCPEYFKTRFSDIVELDDATKDTLTKIYRYIGKDKNLDLNQQDLYLFQEALSKFRCNVSIAEIELLKYIALRVNNESDDSKISILQRNYNDIMSKQNLEVV